MKRESERWSVKCAMFIYFFSKQFFLRNSFTRIVCLSNYRIEHGEKLSS